MDERSKRRRWTEEERIKNDPCAKEHDLSLKCLNDYGRDKNECTPYFENYKYCRKFWSLVQSERKKEGIKPSLPPPEEREEVRKKYLPHLNNE
ncbi:hypothetical protein BsWGS_03099 [Bradybaena similaris]